MGQQHRTIGVDIGGTNIKIGTLRHDGTVLASEHIPTRADAGPEQAVRRLADVLRRRMQEQQIELRELRALGVASAGLVDPERNVVVNSPNLRSWEMFPLAERLQEVTGADVHVENDVNAMAYAEWRCGAGRGTRNLVCLTLGTGVGGGLVLDGRLYRGARGAAGEVGHMSVDVDGPACTCPSRGCLERFVGTAGILERAVRKLAADARPSRLRGGDLDPQRVSAAAEAGDALAAEVLQETGELLGMGLVNLVHIFNPERIVVGGGVAQAGSRLLDPARAMIRRHAMTLPGSMVSVVPAELGNDAPLVGAALLALQRAGERGD